MNTLTLKLDISIDGFVAPEDHNVSWITADFDDEIEAFELDLLRAAGTHVMGRGAYDGMAEHWMQSDEPFAAPMNDKPKVVFSSTLTDPAWPNTTVAAGDLADEVERLKRSDDAGPLLCHGGSRLAGELARLGLIDEYLLLQHPRAIGSGLPLFVTPVALTRTFVRAFATGVVASRFVPAI